MSASPSTGSSGIGPMEPTEPDEDDQESLEKPEDITWSVYKRYFPKTFYTTRGRQVWLLVLAFLLLDMTMAIRYGQLASNPDVLLWDAETWGFTINFVLSIVIVPLILAVMDVVANHLDLEVSDA